MIQIPDGDDGQQVTPFVHIVIDEKDPQLKATMGQGCPVIQLPLHTRPDPYPWPMLTDTQMKIFQSGKLHIPFINWALAEDKDPSLQAEVYQYWAQQKKVSQQAHSIIEARRKLQVKQAHLHNSAWQLSKANAYRHLYPKVQYDYLTPDQYSQEDQAIIVNDLVGGSYHPRAEGCRWCKGRSHNIEQCTSLYMCHFCMEYRHSKQACCAPHTLCKVNKVCHVPLCHHYQLSHCVSTICPLCL